MGTSLGSQKSKVKSKWEVVKKEKKKEKDTKKEDRRLKPVSRCR